MTADPFAVAGAAVVWALLALSLRPFGGGLAERTALVGGLILLMWAAGEISGVFSRIRALLQQAPGFDGAASLALKVTGVAYVAQPASDLCRDCGEEGLASKSELCGRLLMLIAVMPQLTSLASRLIALAEELL